MPFKSTLNSSTKVLMANETFTGQPEDMKQYKYIKLTIDTDRKSIPNGIIIHFSSDNNNWIITKEFTYDNDVLFSKYVPAPLKYFYVEYVNSNMSQTRFDFVCQLFIEKEINIDVSQKITPIYNPYVILDIKHINDKNTINITEKKYGTGTIVYNDSKNSVSMNVLTLNDKVIRQSRKHISYYPEKPIIIYLQCVLNMSNNNSNIITRAGIFDDKYGVFFQG